jgi:hypothetical protein
VFLESESVEHDDVSLKDILSSLMELVQSWAQETSPQKEQHSSSRTIVRPGISHATLEDEHVSLLIVGNPNLSAFFSQQKLLRSVPSSTDSMISSLHTSNLNQHDLDSSAHCSDLLQCVTKQRFRYILAALKTVQLAMDSDQR